MTRTKKGQLAGQIFMYILGIIVVGLLLLLGMRAVDTLQDSKCRAQEARFISTLSSAIDENKGRGISRVEQFTLPCNTQEVCFVSRDVADNDAFSAASDALANQYEIIKNSIESKVNTNVWIRTNEGLNPINKFEVAAPIFLPDEEQIRCIESTDGNSVQIRFKGRGLDVEVEALNAVSAT